MSLPLPEPRFLQRQNSFFLGQWLANFRLHWNHLEVFVNHRFLFSRISDSVGLGVELLSICISNKLLGDADADGRPHFENHSHSLIGQIIGA